MNQFVNIFKIETNIIKACADYLLLKEVKQLNNEIHLIKGSFLVDAIDFVRKISTCQNEVNIHFFLESAYSKFSQSVLLYQNVTQEIFEKGMSDGIIGTIADDFRSQSSGWLAQKYNGVVDAIQAKASTSQNQKDEIDFRMRCLEISYQGKAMCEFYMKEYILCMNTLDTIIGCHLKPIKEVIKYSSFYLDSNNLFIQPIIKSAVPKLMAIEIENHIEIFHAINVISAEHNISVGELQNLNFAINVLSKEDSIYCKELLRKITSGRE